MVRLVALGLAAYCYLQPAFAFADDAAKLVVGTWRLTSWLIQVVGEQQVTEPLGPNPKGRLVITTDGYMSAIIAAATLPALYQFSLYNDCCPCKLAAAVRRERW